MKRRGLGRGLDALLQSTTEEPVAPGAPGSGLETVPIESVRPNPYQPRRAFDADALEELAASIRVQGLIQPLVVTREDDGFCLIAGERRLRAAEMAGLTEVPVIVREAGPREMLALAIVENVQRADLDPLEAAEAYSRLVEDFGLTQAEVADLVGKSRVAVSNTVRLLGLSDEVKALVSGGHLTEGHARALLAIEGPEAQLAAARRAIAGGWTVRRTEAEARRMSEGATGARGKTKSGGRAALDPDTAAAQQALEEALGTRVEIRRSGKGGQVVIHFYSEEELSAIYDHLAGKP